MPVMTPQTTPANDETPQPIQDAGTSLPAMVRWTRAAAVGSLLGLIFLGLAWELVLAPTGNRTLVIKVLPLAVPLIGLLKNRMYTYRWVSLMIWLYFIEGVIRASGDGGQTSGWVVSDGISVAIELQAGDDSWRKGVAQIDDADAIAGGDQGQAGSWVGWIHRQGQI